MIPSDEKRHAMVMRAVNVLKTTSGATIKDLDKTRESLEKAVKLGVGIIEEIHQKSKDKISSLSRQVAPGTSEWDDLFACYVADEYRRRGI